MRLRARELVTTITGGTRRGKTPARILNVRTFNNGRNWKGSSSILLDRTSPDALSSLNLTAEKSRCIPSSSVSTNFAIICIQCRTLALAVSYLGNILYTVPLHILPPCPAGRRSLVQRDDPQEANVLSIQRLIFWNKPPLLGKLPICRICNKSVVLESAKTDENGNAIHEECYLLKIGLKAATTWASKA